MSDVNVDQLKNELEQSKQNAKGLVAQLDATKQMLNEQLQACLQLKTNLIMVQQSYKDLAEKNSRLMDEAKAYKAQLEAKVEAPSEQPDAA